MENYLITGSKAYWRTIISLFLGSFVTFALLYCTQPLIPVFSKEMNIQPAYSSLTVSFATASLAIFMIIMSWLSDSKGRKKIMVMSLLGSSILAIMLPLFSNFYIILGIRALQGALLAGFPAIAMAYISEEFDHATAGLVMGIYISGNTVGGLAGRIIVSFITDFFSWRIALEFIGLLSFACAIWFLFNLPVSQNFMPRKQSVKKTLQLLAENIKNPKLLLIYIMGFLLMGSFVTMYNYISYPLMAPPYQFSQAAVGCIFFVYLMGTFSSTFMGKMADKHGSPKVLIVGIPIMMLGCLMTLVCSIYLKIIGLAFFTFGFFGCHSVASSWIGKTATNSKAHASSLYLLFYYTGSSCLGTIGGQFLLWRGWHGVTLLIGIALLFAIIIAANLLYKENFKASCKNY
ncbi:MAG: major facilitator superfamily 1 [Firmicutes bacterium]|nr:major facilitator superfamily 1 [Bacillota bacterium]